MGWGRGARVELGVKVSAGVLAGSAYSFLLLNLCRGFVSKSLNLKLDLKPPPPSSPPPPPPPQPVPSPSPTASSVDSYLAPRSMVEAPDTLGICRLLVVVSFKAAGGRVPRVRGMWRPASVGAGRADGMLRQMLLPMRT